MSWRFRDSLPALMRQTRRWWIVILGINTALPLIVPQIDIAAHLGGFIAGAIVAVLLIPSQVIGREARLGPIVPVVAGSMVALMVFAIVIQIVGDRSAATIHPLELAQRQQRVAPAALNGLAWAEAIARHPDEQRLVLAQEAATRAVAADPGEAAFLDTLATVCYRRRQLERAISLERLALGLESSNTFYSSQLARFLSAYYQQHGVLTTGEAIDKSSRAGEAEPWAVEVIAGLNGASPPATIYVLAASDRHQQNLHGLLRVCTGSTDFATINLNTMVDISAVLIEAAQNGPVTILVNDHLADISIALVDTTGADCQETEGTVRFWPFDRDVASLPQ
jgi:hypothetical protein